MGGQIDIGRSGLLPNGEALRSLRVEDAKPDIRLRQAVRLGEQESGRDVQQVPGGIRPSTETNGSPAKCRNPERCLVMVSGKQKDIDLDSFGNRINYGPGTDKVVRDFIKSKQSRTYRGIVGTVRVIAIAALVSCILLTPLILRILWRVSEVTQSTNEIVQPLLTDEQKGFSRAIMEDMNKRHQEELKTFHDNPKLFDEYMEKRQ